MSGFMNIELFIEFTNFVITAYRDGDPGRGGAWRLKNQGKLPPLNFISTNSECSTFCSESTKTSVISPKLHSNLCTIISRKILTPSFCITRGLRSPTNPPPHPRSHSLHSGRSSSALRTSLKYEGKY